MGSTSYPNKAHFSYRDSKYKLHDVTLRNISETYNEGLPKGLETIHKSQKEENTSPMGVSQHTMIIYIKISSEVVVTSTLPLN